MEALAWILFGALGALLPRRALPAGFPGARAGCVVVGMLGGFMGGALVPIAAGDVTLALLAVSLLSAWGGGALLVTAVARAGAPGVGSPG